MLLLQITRIARIMDLIWYDVTTISYTLLGNDLYPLAIYNKL